MVVDLNPVGDRTASLLHGLEALAMCALLFAGANHTLSHAVMLRAVRRDELLAQTAATYQGRVSAAGKDGPIVTSRQEWLRYPPKRAEAGDQRMLQRT